MDMLNEILEELEKNQDKTIQEKLELVLELGISQLPVTLQMMVKANFTLVKRSIYEMEAAEIHTFLDLLDGILCELRESL